MAIEERFSLVTAEKVHSITFKITTGNEEKTYNTWDTWRLIPTKRPFVEAPQPDTTYIDIPGRSGSLDYTGMNSGGELSFRDREGSWGFIMIPNGSNILYRYSNILLTLHGKKMKVILDDRPEFYFYGRITVGTPSSERDYSGITLAYRLDPYKIKFENGSKSL